jgi:nitrate reductase gamma subunit
MGSRSGPVAGEPVAHRDAFVTGGAYGLLLVLGLIEGLIGSFTYSAWMIGSFPAAALLLCVILLATCVFGAWGMTSVAGAIVPALGWIVASFVLDSPSRQGSVIVAAVPSGEFYLYGGSVAALLAIAAAFALWIRRAGRKPPP